MNNLVIEPTKYTPNIVFLFDEKGLEIVPKTHNKRASHEVEKKLESYLSSHLPGSIHLKSQAGNILFFHPAVLHRGISNSFRANIHFRFQKSSSIEHLDFKNLLDFNKEWVEILSHKESVIVDPLIEKYVQPSGALYFLKKSVKTFVHYVFFFLPCNFILFRWLSVRPNLKLRKYLSI